MQSRIRFAVRALACLAVVALVPTLVSSPVPTSGPYGSALSTVATVSVFAAGSCNNKACSQAPRGLKFTCVSSPGTNCKTVQGGTDCAVSNC